MTRMTKDEAYTEELRDEILQLASDDSYSTGVRFAAMISAYDHMLLETDERSRDVYATAMLAILYNHFTGDDPMQFVKGFVEEMNKQAEE